MTLLSGGFHEKELSCSMVGGYSFGYCIADIFNAEKPPKAE
jgi:hypothetical protein